MLDGLRTGCVYDICHANMPEDTQCQWATYMAEEACPQFLSSAERTSVKEEFHCGRCFNIMLLFTVIRFDFHVPFPLTMVMYTVA